MFHPNQIQRRHLLERSGYNRGYIVKARQFGITTLYSIDLLDDALWVPGMSCAIQAHEREALDKIFEIVKRAYENLPEGIKPKVRTDTIRKYSFVERFDGEKLDSEIFVALKLRSTTVRRLHITESAYIKDRSEMKSGSKQAVPKDGYITEETTGNGMEDFFDDYMTAYEKKKAGQLTSMDYNTYFYPWFENKEYSLDGALPEEMRDKVEKDLVTKFHLTDGQLLWRRWKMEEMKQKEDGVGLNTEQMFKQEYPATLLEAFQSGTGNVFNLEKLEAMQPRNPLGGVDVYNAMHKDWQFLSAQEQHDNNQIYQQFQKFTQLGVRFWHLPEKGVKYVVGCDPSDGSGGDSSGTDVWTRDPANGKILQCAQFFGQMRPDNLAQLIKLLAEMYNDAFVGVENNMLTTILFLKEIYDNYYMEVSIDNKSAKRSTKLGFSTNVKTRDPMIDEFLIQWEEDGLEINSEITIKQMRTFVRKENGKREHIDGKSDDALFGAFIALQMRKHEPPRGRVFAHKPAGF